MTPIFHNNFMLRFCHSFSQLAFCCAFFPLEFDLVFETRAREIGGFVIRFSLFLFFLRLMDRALVSDFEALNYFTSINFDFQDVLINSFCISKEKIRIKRFFHVLLKNNSTVDRIASMYVRGKTLNILVLSIFKDQHFLSD